MTEKPKRQNEPSAIDTVYAYHDRTKHQLHRYSRSLGYMDWDSQPDPFRRYHPTVSCSLDHLPVTETPTYDSLFHTELGPPQTINRESVSRLFYESLAISAWKQAGGNRWSLRVNPSSGDLHPTEAYLITAPIKELTEVPAVFHYSSLDHALERRVVLTTTDWNILGENMPPDFLLVALASIYWRESWKYGERAFRYCHHDVGHAVGSVAFAAATLGWNTRLIHSLTDDELATLLGVQQIDRMEVEEPDCMLAIFPADQNRARINPVINLPAPLLDQLRTSEFEGSPNALSNDHHEWPIIDSVSRACRFNGNCSSPNKPGIEREGHKEFSEDRPVSARKIIRERRSALAMDSCTAIDHTTFYKMMQHLLPHERNNIMEVLPWRPCVSIALFIHRVDGLASGLYILARDRSHESSLRKALQTEFRWEKPKNCPEFLDLYLLKEADVRDAACMVCCHQHIASNGAFALSMLAAFDVSLEQNGPSVYPRLFWETGLIGQILYLEAEAAGIRSTGIGCFFDDAMHELLGIRDHSWQSLYHFTVGGAVDDPRLQTLPSYWHLK